MDSHTPDRVRSDPKVIAAYLGVPDEELADGPGTTNEGGGGDASA